MARESLGSLVELHITYIPADLWNDKLNYANCKLISEIISVGFVRVFPAVTVNDLRRAITTQLGDHVFPQDYVFLKQIGRRLVLVREKQEMELVIANFIPPESNQPEMYILPKRPPLYGSGYQLLPPITPQTSGSGSHLPSMMTGRSSDSPVTRRRSTSPRHSTTSGHSGRSSKLPIPKSPTISIRSENEVGDVIEFDQVESHVVEKLIDQVTGDVSPNLDSGFVDPTARSRDHSPRHSLHRRSPHHSPHRGSPHHSPHRRSPHHSPHRRSPHHSPHRGSPHHSPHRRSPHHSPHRASPHHSPHRRSPHHSPHRRSPHHSPHRRSPHRKSPHHSPHRRSPHHSPHRRSPHHSPHRASPHHSRGSHHHHSRGSPHHSRGSHHHHSRGSPHHSRGSHHHHSRGSPHHSRGSHHRHHSRGRKSRSPSPHHRSKSPKIEIQLPKRNQRIGLLSRKSGRKSPRKSPSPKPHHHHHSRSPSPGRKSADLRAMEEQRLELLRRLERIRLERRQKEKVREEIVKLAKSNSMKINQRRNTLRDMWKKRFFEEKKKTSPLEDVCQRLRNQIDSKQQKLMADLGKLNGKPSATRNHQLPSVKNNGKMQASKLQHEVEVTKRQVETAKIKLTGEMKLRHQAEEDVKILRQELLTKKIRAHIAYRDLERTRAFVAHSNVRSHDSELAPIDSNPTRAIS